MFYIFCLQPLASQPGASPATAHGLRQAVHVRPMVDVTLLYVKVRETFNTQSTGSVTYIFGCPRGKHPVNSIYQSSYGQVSESATCSLTFIPTPQPSCAQITTLSSELWEFNPLSSIWTEIVVNGTTPAPRDGHTANVVGSKMIVFGGRGNSSTAGHGTALLGDEWIIDLDPSQPVSVKTNSSTVGARHRTFRKAVPILHFHMVGLLGWRWYGIWTNRFH